MNQNEALTFLETLTVEAADQADSLSTEGLRTYLVQHIDRFVMTYNLLEKHLPAGTPASVLDIGSFPYFLPVMLQDRLGAEVVGIDSPTEAYWPGAPYTPSQREVTVSRGEKQYRFTHHLINIERDPIPYQDQFDAVLLTEVLEHLTLQPNVVVQQIHRSLKPGGVVILTTPNAKYLMKLLAAIRGSNINEKYNLLVGAYGRHNREFTLQETAELLETHNFRILDGHLVNFKKPHLSGSGRLKYGLIDTLTHLPGLRSRQEGIIVVAQKHGESVLREPVSLFRRG